MNLIKAGDLVGSYLDCVGVGKLKNDHVIHICVETGYTNKISLVIEKNGYPVFSSYAEDVQRVPLKFTAARVIGAHQSETPYSIVYNFLRRFCVGEFYMVTETKRVVLGNGLGEELTWHKNFQI